MKIKIRILALFILMFQLTSVYSVETSSSEKYLLPIDISGKILDKDGNLSTDKATLQIRTKTMFDDEKTVAGISETKQTYEQEISGGYFNWKGRATSVDISVKKEGYYSTLVSPDMTEVGDSFEIKSKDIVLYMIAKGSPATLEYTNSAQIPYDETGKIKYGWSFKRRWYFPSTEEDIDIIFTVDENDKSVYTMKEPGGFIYFPGYPQFESQQNRPWADFDWMPQAPESGYVSTISPDDHKEQRVYQYAGSVYYYFKTCYGRYGKLVFHGGYFDYYLQPDGSRNLEAGEIIKKYPVNPIEANRYKGY